MHSFIKSAPLVASMFLAACGQQAPDHPAIQQAVKETSLAQGGVCKGQAFPWISKRSYGLAKVNDDNTVLVINQTPSDGGRVAGKQEEHIVIPGLAIKSADQCGFKGNSPS